MSEKHSILGGRCMSKNDLVTLFGNVQPISPEKIDGLAQRKEAYLKQKKLLKIGISN